MKGMVYLTQAEQLFDVQVQENLANDLRRLTDEILQQIAVVGIALTGPIGHDVRVCRIRRLRHNIQTQTCVGLCRQFSGIMKRVLPGFNPERRRE